MVLSSCEGRGNGGFVRVEEEGVRIFCLLRSRGGVVLSLCVARGFEGFFFSV